MKKLLIILMVLCFSTPLVAQDSTFQNSYFAVGLSFDNLTVTEPVEVGIQGAWLLEIKQDIFVAPIASFNFGDKQSPEGGAGAKMFYSDSDFGKFISIGATSTYGNFAPQYDVITGLGFTSAWSFMGIHPGFMVNWIPTADGEDNEITLSLFGIF